MIIPSNALPGRPAATRPEAPPALYDITFATILNKTVTEPGDEIAARFNEYGFFAPTPGPTVSTPPTSPDLVPLTEPKPIAGNRPHDVGRSRDIGAVEQTVVRTGSPHVVNDHDGHRFTVQPAPVTSSATSGPFPIAAPPPAAPNRETVSAIRPATMRAALRLPADTAPVAVALHDVASGLAVIARVTGLDPVDRVRLADEIAGLLARYGLSAADIVIATPVGAYRGRKEQ